MRSGLTILSPTSKVSNSKLSDHFRVCKPIEILIITYFILEYIQLFTHKKCKRYFDLFKLNARFLKFRKIFYSILKLKLTWFVFVEFEINVGGSVSSPFLYEITYLYLPLHSYFQFTSNFVLAGACSTVTFFGFKGSTKKGFVLSLAFFFNSKNHLLNWTIWLLNCTSEIQISMIELSSFIFFFKTVNKEVQSYK